MADDEVGYGKPPKHARFQAGKSGNPRGRPKGARNVDTLLRKILDERVAVQMPDGKRRKVSKREIILIQMANKAVKGDARAAEYLIGKCEVLDMQQLGEVETAAPLTEVDQIVFAELKRRIARADGEADER